MLPISGNPAGQSVVFPGKVAVILTYFNGGLERAGGRDEPDGCARFMLVNLTDEPQILSVIFSVAYRQSDAFTGLVEFTDILPERSCQMRQVVRREFKTATYATFFAWLGGEKLGPVMPNDFQQSSWAQADLVEIAREEFPPPRGR